MGMLEYGVVAAVVSGGADIYALLVGDFLGADQVRRIAGSRSRNRRIKWVRKVVS
jgi:hypothetical protein